ncbi:MAG: biopolymer transporter ExbD [Acidobacteriota bacterium]|nr:biopolymer transporter ExbD [Acidobacteriota bacterium]
MELHAQKAVPPVIPTASMADIAFLLIIFFMVTFTIEVDKTQVTLPTTQIRQEVPKKAAMVSITEAGQIRVSDGEQMSAPVPSTDDVLSFAAEVIGRDPTKEFVLKADSNTPYRVVDEAIDALKQAQVRIIYLLSGAETVDQQSGDAAPAGN